MSKFFADFVDWFIENFSNLFKGRLWRICNKAEKLWVEFIL